VKVAPLFQCVSKFLQKEDFTRLIANIIFVMQSSSCNAPELQEPILDLPNNLTYLLRPPKNALILFHPNGKIISCLIVSFKSRALFPTDLQEGILRGRFSQTTQVLLCVLVKKYVLHLYAGIREIFVICGVLLVWQQMLLMAFISKPFLI